MKTHTLLAFSATALLVTGSAFACPKKDKAPSPGADEGVYEVSAEGAKKGNCKNKDRQGSEEGVFEVRDGEGGERAERGERRRAERPERGERGERPEHGERGERGEKHRHGDRRNPLAKLGLSEDQKAQAKEIFEASREQAKELMASLKEKRENGEEIDREAVREQMHNIRKGAMDKVYATVLNDEQKAKVDEHRKKMEEHRKEMEERRAEREKNGEGKERPERKGKKGNKDREGSKKRGGDDLDL